MLAGFLFTPFAWTMFGFTSESAGSAIRREQYNDSRFAEVAITLLKLQ
jgi:hypothetical protein